MSEGQGRLFEATFNRSIKVQVADERITSDAGLVLLREADHRLGLTAGLAGVMLDPRDPTRIRYTLSELLRARIYALAQGLPAQDDLDTLAHDPAMKLAVWDRPGERVADERLASQSSHSRLLDLLTGNKSNLEALRGGLGEGFIHAVLRRGNCSSAEGAVRFIRAAVQRGRLLARSLDGRLDAAFIVGPVLAPLTDDGIRFLGRLRSNAVVQALAAPYLKRPVGRPPTEGYQFTVELGPYQAASWRHAQRLILVVVDGPDPVTGQLLLEPDHFFLLTNWRAQEKGADEVLDHYRNRGTFEDRFGELNAAIHVRLSLPTFAENEATLLLGLRLGQTPGPRPRPWVPPPRHAHLHLVLRC